MLFRSVGILDGDVYGPSQPTMFGLKDAKLAAVQTPDGDTIAVPVTKYGIKVASMGFVMQQEEAAIVRGPMRSEERRVGKECRSRWSPYH